LTRFRSKTLAKLVLLPLTVVGVVFVIGCSAQGDSPKLNLNDLPKSSGIIDSGVSITPQQAFTLIEENKNNPDFVIIDSRRQSKYSVAHIENAMNIYLNTSDIDSFRSALSGLDKNRTYLTYCPTGCGSDAKEMKSLGFTKVYNMQGGINQWIAEGLPVVE
jgi:rhodanese-related sulfurtransferase